MRDADWFHDFEDGVYLCMTSGDASNLSSQSLFKEAALTGGETQLSPTVCIS